MSQADRNWNTESWFLWAANSLKWLSPASPKGKRDLHTVDTDASHRTHLWRKGLKGILVERWALPV